MSDYIDYEDDDENDDVNREWVQWELDCEEYLYEVLRRKDLSDSAKVLFCLIMDVERHEMQFYLDYESASKVLSWTMDKVKNVLRELVDGNAVYCHRQDNIIVCMAMVQREINKLIE